MASYLAGLEILAGGIVCLALVQPRFRVFPRWLPRIGGWTAPRSAVFVLAVVPALIGGAVAVSHGVSGIITKALDLIGVISPYSSAPLPFFTAFDAWRWTGGTSCSTNPGFCSSACAQR